MTAITSIGGAQKAREQGARETREQRLARARLSLIEAESSVGLAPVVSLERGRVWHVESGNAAVFQALSDLHEAGQWIGFIGFRNVGWSAVKEYGLPLSKILYVPSAAQSALQAFAALIDGVDLIVAGPVGLSARDQKALAGRVRARRSTVLTTSPWRGVSRPWKTRGQGLGAGGRSRQNSLGGLEKAANGQRFNGVRRVG
ncbi:MAG: hypothetical protein Q4D87_09180 [Actinomycetaceae bacterium]|nr:hypothetical protein [Actinomycetaceae bacterium]